jgi:hypothetical protein
MAGISPVSCMHCVIVATLIVIIGTLLRPISMCMYVHPPLHVHVTLTQQTTTVDTFIVCCICILSTIHIQYLQAQITYVVDVTTNTTMSNNNNTEIANDNSTLDIGTNTEFAHIDHTQRELFVLTTRTVLDRHYGQFCRTIKSITQTCNDDDKQFDRCDDNDKGGMTNVNLSQFNTVITPNGCMRNRQRVLVVFILLLISLVIFMTLTCCSFTGA